MQQRTNEFVLEVLDSHYSELTPSEFDSFVSLSITIINLTEDIFIGYYAKQHQST